MAHPVHFWEIEITPGPIHTVAVAKGRDTMERGITVGNEPLGATGLVALTPCGHWWVYPTPATAEQMHDVARFNLGIVCSFCLGDWHAATCAQARGPAGRVN